MGTVISAQIFGVPICLVYFGYFSWVSIIANFLLIPVVGVLFTLTFILLAISMIALPNVFLFLPDKALYVLEKLITIFDHKHVIVKNCNKLF